MTSLSRRARRLLYGIVRRHRKHVVIYPRETVFRRFLLVVELWQPPELFDKLSKAQVFKPSNVAHDPEVFWHVRCWVALEGSYRNVGLLAECAIVPVFESHSVRSTMTSLPGHCVVELLQPSF